MFLSVLLLCVFCVFCDVCFIFLFVVVFLKVHGTFV